MDLVSLEKKQGNLVPQTSRRRRHRHAGEVPQVVLQAVEDREEKAKEKEKEQENVLLDLRDCLEKKSNEA